MQEISLLEAISWLVAASGFITWAIFIPQIKKLIDVKNSNSISLWTSWLSWLLQFLVLLQASLLQNWALVFAQGVSISFLTITIAIVYYYRVFPGGKN